MKSRFDYVKYDDVATADQAALKAKVQEIEELLERVETARLEMAALIEKTECPTEANNYAIDKLADATGPDIEEALKLLEEAYMWCGKMIRDQQLERNKDTVLQEGRNNE